MPLDPAFFRSPNEITYPPRPLSVVGFTFDPATRIFDFSAVPGFDLSKLQSLWHAQSRSTLYMRPLPRPFDAVEVDGVAVPDAPTSRTRIKVKIDTTNMSATDEVIAFYDPD